MWKPRCGPSFGALTDRADVEYLVQWIEEVLHYCPGVRIILVALKCDLREDPAVVQQLRSRGINGPIRYEEGLEVAKRIRAVRYLGEFLNTHCHEHRIFVCRSVSHTSALPLQNARPR